MAGGVGGIVSGYDSDGRDYGTKVTCQVRVAYHASRAFGIHGPAGTISSMISHTDLMLAAPELSSFSCTYQVLLQRL